MYEINLAKRLSQAPVHLVTDRASLLTDHRMSGLTIRARYKRDGDHPGKDLRLRITALFFCPPVRNISQRIFKHVLPCRRNTLLFVFEIFPTLVIFQLLQQKYVIRPFFCIHPINITFGLQPR